MPRRRKRPRAAQYLTPEDLARHCPVPFELRVLHWHVRDNTADQLRAMYRHLASFYPTLIFSHPEDQSCEARFVALVDEARRYEEETGGIVEQA